MFKKNTEQELLLKRMSACGVFNGLSNSEISTLLKISHIRDYSEGEKIFEEGTIGLCFYIIVKGSIKILTAKDGVPRTLRHFHEGEYFSEVHLFAETFHSVSCVSDEVTKLIVFAKPDFEDFVNIKPKLSNKVLSNFLVFFGEKLDELYRENRELKHKLHQVIKP